MSAGLVFRGLKGGVQVCTTSSDIAASPIPWESDETDSVWIQFSMQEGGLYKLAPNCAALFCISLTLEKALGLTLGFVCRMSQSSKCIRPVPFSWRCLRRCGVLFLCSCSIVPSDAIILKNFMGPDWFQSRVLLPTSKFWRIIFSPVTPIANNDGSHQAYSCTLKELSGPSLFGCINFFSHPLNWWMLYLPKSSLWLQPHGKRCLAFLKLDNLVFRLDKAAIYIWVWACCRKWPCCGTSTLTSEVLSTFALGSSAQDVSRQIENTSANKLKVATSTDTVYQSSLPLALLLKALPSMHLRIESGLQCLFQNS